MLGTLEHAPPQERERLVAGGNRHRNHRAARQSSKVPCVTILPVILRGLRDTGREPLKLNSQGAGLGCASCSASISARISSDSFTSMLPMFSFSCASEVAPTRLLVVNGRLFTNESA